MNKEDSLTFLNKCIDDINNLTSEQIGLLREKYDKYCNTEIQDTEFEFIEQRRR